MQGKLVRHKLWPFQNGMFSITEIGKNRKNREKNEVSNKTSTVGHLLIATAYDNLALEYMVRIYWIM